MAWLGTYKPDPNSDHWLDRMLIYLEEIDRYLDELAAQRAAEYGLEIDAKIMADYNPSEHVNCACNFADEVAHLRQPIAPEEDAEIIAAAREYIRTIDGLSKAS